MRYSAYSSAVGACGRGGPCAESTVGVPCRAWVPTCRPDSVPTCRSGSEPTCRPRTEPTPTCRSGTPPARRVRPVLARRDGRSVPDLPRAASATVACTASSEYDAWALPRFDDVWDVLADRERFSIFEGPVFHRDRLLRHNHGPPPDTSRCGRCGPSRCSTPRVHTALRQALSTRSGRVPSAELEADVRALAAAQPWIAWYRSDALRRPPRLRVAGGGSGRRARERVPGRGGAGRRRLVNRYVQRDPGQAGISEAGRRRTTSSTLACSATSRRAAAPAGRASARPRRRRWSIRAGSCRTAAAPCSNGRPAARSTTPRSSTSCHAVHRRHRDAAEGRGGWRVRALAPPDQRAGVTLDPSLAVPAFEEMLRHQLPLQFVGRTLRVDAEVAGVPMRAGQRVVLLLISREPRRARVRRAGAVRRRTA